MTEYPTREDIERALDWMSKGLFPETTEQILERAARAYLATLDETHIALVTVLRSAMASLEEGDDTSAYLVIKRALRDRG